MILNNFRKYCDFINLFIFTFNKYIFIRTLGTYLVELKRKKKKIDLNNIHIKII